MDGEIEKLKAEVARLTKQVQTLSVASTSSRDSSIQASQVVRKELGLQSLIQPWSGGEGEDDVDTFLQHLDMVAVTGGWSEQEKMLICRSKLTGAAKACITAHPELLKPTAQFQEYTTILRQRFEGFSTPEQRLLQLNSIEQLSGEKVRDYADRCRRVGEQATPKSSSAEEATWIRGHFDRVVTAAFIKGLKPEVRRQLQFDPPSSFQEAVNKASRVEQALTDDPTSKDVWAIQQERVVGGRSAPKSGSSSVLCYRCHQKGHIARDCSRPNVVPGPGNRRSLRLPTPGVCFVCGSTSHFARACPRRATRAVTVGEEAKSPMIPKAGGSTEAPPS
ncbi:uncharacterized protein [Rhodnius prolixus]|uniref:uncharacterized protein n=1 Tax=Rhodnius prolixus TaxID=13249 RepID=UPI003D18D590